MDVIAVPGPLAPAPMGVTTALLVAWLAAHHDILLPPGTRLADVAREVEDAYGTEIRPKGSGLFPSDVWAHVAREERGLRGGQRSLDLGDGAAAAPKRRPEARAATGMAPAPPTAAGILSLVHDMREAQKTYFATKSTRWLKESKRLERAVDEALAILWVQFEREGGVRP